MIFQLIYLTYTKIAQHAQVLFFIFLFSFLELVRVVQGEVLEFAPHIMIGAPTPLPGISKSVYAEPFETSAPLSKAVSICLSLHQSTIF